MSDEQQDTTLYVLVPPSPLFAAHWSFFLPDSKGYDSISKRHEESSVGTRIHVAGDRLNGFSLEIIREYDVSKHRSVGSRKFAIGTVPAQHSQRHVSKAGNDISQSDLKDEDEGGGFVDNEPRDGFEQTCVDVAPPGPSLNPVTGGGSGPMPKKTKGEVRDCQWWVRQVTNELTAAGLLANLPQAHGSRSKIPKDLVDELPLH